MIRAIKTQYIGEDLVYCELALNSRDSKPTTVGGDKLVNGSMAIETDTGKLFVFDEDDQSWTEIGGSSAPASEEEPIEPEA